MAKKRKIATKTATKTASKTAAAPTKSRKFSRDDNRIALVIAAAIVIVFAALYLYQKNAKPKAAQLDGLSAIVSVEQA